MLEISTKSNLINDFLPKILRSEENDNRPLNENRLQELSIKLSNAFAYYFMVGDSAFSKSPNEMPSQEELSLLMNNFIELIKETQGVSVSESPESRVPRPTSSELLTREQIQDRMSFLLQKNGYSSEEFEKKGDSPEIFGVEYLDWLLYDSLKKSLN